MAKHTCKIPDPPPDTTRWMGTYGDMVTLLMAFFVMLFAVSETNNEKFVAFVAGLAGPFDNPALELGLVDGTALLESDVSPISLIAPPAAQAELVRADPEVAQEVIEVQEAQDQLEELKEQLGEVLEATEVPISVDLRDDERGLVISISTDDVLFPVGSAEISGEGRQLIGVIAPVLVGAPNTVVIEGHTDDQPLDAGGYTNWNLSTDRAVAVLELLGEEHGLPWSRVSASGYGEHRPLVPNSSPEGRSINRRVEILMVSVALAEEGDAAPPPPAAEAPAPPVSFPVDTLPDDRLPDDEVVVGDGPAGAAGSGGGTPLASILGPVTDR